MLMSANRITEVVSTFVAIVMVATGAAAGKASHSTKERNHASVSCAK